MDDLLEWLDAYELELAERDLREPIPKELFRAWYQRAYQGKPNGNWYEFEDEDG